MKERYQNIEQRKIEVLLELRKKIHEQIKEETKERIKNNPHPTEREIMVGAFREMIEPQVRDALFEFNRKGYSTESSGFSGNGELQSLDGYFEIDETTKQKLEAIDVQVLKGKDFGRLYESEGYTYIQFKPEDADINKIKEKWNEIASLLPSKEKPMLPSISGGSEDFRKQYAPQRTDIEKMVLEKRLALTESHPDTEEEMRKRIKEIEGQENKK